VQACCDSERDMQTPRGGEWVWVGVRADHLYSAAFLTRQHKPSRHITPQPDTRVLAGGCHRSLTQKSSILSHGNQWEFYIVQTMAIDL
jgi:hypothetical protein